MVDMKPRLILNRKLQSLFRHGDLFVRRAFVSEEIVVKLKNRNKKFYNYMSLAVKREFRDSGVWARSELE